MIQVVTGVTLENANEEKFKTTFKTAIADALGLTMDRIKITKISEITGRRLSENNTGRRLANDIYSHFRSLIETSVFIEYTVTAANTNAAAVQSAIAAASGNVAAALVSSGYAGATVADPVLATSAPTAAPVMAHPFSVGAIIGIAVGGFVAISVVVAVMCMWSRKSRARAPIADTGN